MSSSRFFNSHAARFAATILVGAFSIASQFAAPNLARADILVVAPHPDDDIITAAGVIYRARQAGTVVWVAYMTNGDYFPTGTAWGRQRADEAVVAQNLLGVAADHLLFLGYPDGSLQDLYGPSYAAAYTLPAGMNQSSTTYTRTGSVPYSQIRTGGSVAVRGENVNADLVFMLQQIAPSDIFVVCPDDMHPDHSATSLFVTDAVAVRRAAAGYNPIVHYTLVWDSTAKPIVWPLAPNATTFFSEPPLLATKPDPLQIGYVWAERESLDVPLTMQVTDWLQNLKAQAITAHNTQGGFTGARDDGHISSFAHKDEFFFPRRIAGTARTTREASTDGPVPNAGLDQSVLVGASVQLNGSGSSAPSGRSLTYSWRQQDGPSVALSGSGTATPSFTVAASASGATLTFELRVNDGLATSVPDAVSVRVSGTRPPDAGTPPPVDAGTPPPVDAGTPPIDSGTPRDSGTPPPADAGTPPADSGSRLDATVNTDSGNPSADSGSTQVDTGAHPADAGTTVDSGAGLDPGTIADAGVQLDAGAAVLDAGAPPDLSFGGGTSAWPGDSDFDQNVSDIVVGDDGSALPNAKEGSGCGIAARSSDAPFSVLAIALGLSTLRLRRRRSSRLG